LLPGSGFQDENVVADKGSIADLNEVLRRAWVLLERGVEGSAADMRTLVLATRGLDDRPNARTVVLWRVDRARHALYFNTDVRSPKYAELKREPHAALVFYDERAETQLRIRAEIRLCHDDATARAGWAELPAHMRRLFMTQTPPGHEAPGPTTGVPEAWRDHPPPEAEAEGYRNFVTVEAVMLHLDWLHFSSAGHRRAGFSWTHPLGSPHAVWLYP
jgi:pyridoxamine 5'-phosphate oxidase